MAGDANTPKRNRKGGLNSLAGRDHILKLIEQGREREERYFALLAGNLGGPNDQGNRPRRKAGGGQSGSDSGSPAPGTWCCTACGYKENLVRFARCKACKKPTRPAQEPNKSQGANPGQAQAAKAVAKAAAAKPPKAQAAPTATPGSPTEDSPTKVPTLADRLAAANKQLESVKNLPDPQERDEEVQRWTAKVDSLKKEQLAARPLTSKMQSCSTKLQNASKAVVDAKESITKLEQQLEDAKKAHTEAVAAEAAAQEELRLLKEEMGPEQAPSPLTQPDFLLAVKALIGCLQGMGDLPKELRDCATAVWFGMPGAAPPSPTQPTPSPVDEFLGAPELSDGLGDMAVDPQGTSKREMENASSEPLPKRVNVEPSPAEGSIIDVSDPTQY